MSRTRGRKYLFDPQSFVGFLLNMPERKVGSMIHTIALLDAGQTEVAQLILDLSQKAELNRTERSRLFDAFEQSLLLTSSISVMPKYFGEVCRISLGQSIDVRMASLIFAARRYRLKLVTGSADLARVASSYCKVVQPELLLSDGKNDGNSLSNPSPTYEQSK